TNLQFKAAEANRNAKENAALLSPEQLQGFEEAYAASVDRLARARKREKTIAAIQADAQRVSGDMPGPGSKSFERLMASLAGYLDTYVPGAPPLRETGTSAKKEIVASTGKEDGRSTARRTSCVLTRDAVDPMTGFR